jgi:glucosamine kinase
MKLKRLIADSGGTKTDWYGIDFQNTPIRFTTGSYHPILVDETFTAEQVLFWKQYDISECFLHFFGSGCLKTENQLKMKALFEAIGFDNALVESDLFAAARVIEDEKSMIAICGTGSVLFNVEYDQVIELRGGLGWENGDEGSGYYFGKLLLERITTNENRYPEITAIVNEWTPIEELLSLKNNPASKYQYAHLSILFGNHSSHPLIAGIHMENVQLFLEKYAADCHLIHFVGSYAYHTQDVFRFACSQRSIEIGTFIERPIESLAERMFRP